MTAERIAELDGFGETSANALMREIEGSKESPFGRVLYALGLPGIGWVNAAAIAEHFGSIDALTAAAGPKVQLAGERVSTTNPQFNVSEELPEGSGGRVMVTVVKKKKQD